MSNLSETSQVNDLTPSHPVTRFPLWVSLVVTLGVFLSITGAVISKVNPVLLASGGSVTEIARVYADYMFARSLVLAAMLLALLSIRARRMLAGFMILVALIQFVDSVDDLLRGALLLVPGLLVFAGLFLAGAWRLFGQAPWRLKAWREQHI